MRFVSKNMNLRIVLSHGIPAEPMSGRNAVPGQYVKFESGLANVEDEEMIRKMLNHPGFNSDYILVEEEAKDPYADYRSEKEPQHIMSEIKYGQVGKPLGAPAPLTRDQKQLLKPMAEQMAKEMFKEMAPTLMKEMLKAMTDSKPKEEENGVVDMKTEDVEVADIETKDIYGQTEIVEPTEDIAKPVKRMGRPPKIKTTETV